MSEFTEQELDAFMAVVLVQLGPEIFMYKGALETINTQVYIRFRSEWFKDDPRVPLSTWRDPFPMKHPLHWANFKPRYERMSKNLTQPIAIESHL